MADRQVRPEPKTIEVRIRENTYGYRYWKTRWLNPATRRSYHSFVVRFKVRGHCWREKFSTFKKARARCEEVAIAEANHDAARLELSPARHRRLEYLEESASSLGATPEQLIAAGHNALSASRTKFVPKTCPEIVEELLAAKRAEGAGIRWIDDLDCRLGKFAEHFTRPLADIGSEDIKLWLTRLNLSKRTSNNYRTVIQAMIVFAREHKYVPADYNPLAGLKPFKLLKPVEDIYTPQELRSMLFTAEKFYPQHLPTLAIMAIAGCRHCELKDQGEVLDWKNIHFQTAQIHISEAVAKSNTGRRYVPMQSSLVEWIQPYARPRGPVCVVDNLTNALARIAKKAGVPWKRNALRNSFISYRCAATQNIPQVASEAGNSVSEVNDSYRKETTAEEGLAWFEIRPTRPDVLPLFAYRPK